MGLEGPRWKWTVLVVLASRRPVREPGDASRLVRVLLQKLVCYIAGSTDQWQSPIRSALAAVVVAPATDQHSPEWRRVVVVEESGRGAVQTTTSSREWRPMTPLVTNLFHICSPYGDPTLERHVLLTLQVDDLTHLPRRSCFSAVYPSRYPTKPQKYVVFRPRPRRRHQDVAPSPPRHVRSTEYRAAAGWAQRRGITRSRGPRHPHHVQIRAAASHLAVVNSDPGRAVERGGPRSSSAEKLRHGHVNPGSASASHPGHFREHATRSLAGKHAAGLYYLTGPPRGTAATHFQCRPLCCSPCSAYI